MLLKRTVKAAGEAAPSSSRFVDTARQWPFTNTRLSSLSGDAVAEIIVAQFHFAFATMRLSANRISYVPPAPLSLGAGRHVTTRSGRRSAQRSRLVVFTRAWLLLSLTHSLAHAGWNVQKANVEKAAAAKAAAPEPKAAPKAKARGGGE